MTFDSDKFRKEIYTQLPSLDKHKQAELEGMRYQTGVWERVKENIFLLAVFENCFDTYNISIMVYKWKQ